VARRIEVQVEAEKQKRKGKKPIEGVEAEAAEA